MPANTSIEPWLDIIITTSPPEDITEQGVILSAETEEEKKKKPEKGIVVAIGQVSEESKSVSKLLENISIGDMVFYERYTSNEIPDPGQKYNFVRFKYIMGFKKL